MVSVSLGDARGLAAALGFKTLVRLPLAADAAAASLGALVAEASLIANLRLGAATRLRLLPGDLGLLVLVVWRRWLGVGPVSRCTARFAAVHPTVA